jgi:hypothetical protein
LAELLASEFLAIRHKDDLPRRVALAETNGREEYESVRRYASIQKGSALIADLELLEP